MERFKFINRKTIDKQQKTKINLFKEIADFIIAIIIAVGAHRVIITSLGLSWNYKTPFSGGFREGLVNVWNAAASQIAQQSGVFLDKLEGGGDNNGFFFTVVLVFFIILALLVVKSRKKWLGSIFIILCLIPTVGLSMSASVLSVAILSCGLLMFFVNCESQDLRKNFRGLIYVICIVLVAFVLMSLPFLSKIADRPESIHKARENFSEKWEDAYYGENLLKDGYLLEKQRGKEKGTALIVNMDKNDSLYLRGFVGDLLGKKGWEPLSYGTYYENRALFFWLNELNFNGLGQVGQARELSMGEGKLNEISVEVKDANSKYAYIPYEISADGIENSKNWGDSFLTGGRGKKMKTYSYTAGESATGKWTNIAGKLFTKKKRNIELNSYFECEGYYNEYVYNKFTYISEDERSLLRMNVGESGDQTLGHVDYAKAIKMVRKELSSYTYTEDLEGYSPKASALENFFDNREGYDAQFATAAVVMFRYYGIPARYVEGYIIKPSDVRSGKGAIEVPRNNIHAWPEIYVDGVGFVPVEVSTPYMGIMKEADLSVGIQNKTERDIEDQSKIHEDNPNVEMKDHSSGSLSKLPNKALIIIGIVVGLLLLVALVLASIVIGKKVARLRRRNRLIKSGDPKDAVKELFKKMDEKKIPHTEETLNLGNKATYSELKIYEEDRTKMLTSIKQIKKSIRKQKKDELKKKLKYKKNAKKNEKNL